MGKAIITNDRPSHWVVYAASEGACEEARRLDDSYDWITDEGCNPGIVFLEESASDKKEFKTLKAARGWCEGNGIPWERIL